MRNNGGYLSQACSAAESLATLYTHAMNLGPSVAPPLPLPFAGVPSAQNPDAFTGAGYHGAKHPDRDRFIISPAHYALVIYAALIEVGRMAPAALELFNQDGGSVEMIGAEHSPGMEVTTGSLAQGLSMAIGVAMARKRRGEQGRVWVYASDGELQEGQTWEAFANLHSHRVDNLTVYFDVNSQQCDGAMCDVLQIEPIAEKLRSFGAEVVEIDGHNLDEIAAATARRPQGKAVAILARTSPYEGMDVLRQRFPRLHYVRFKNRQERDELEAAIRAQLYPDALPVTAVIPSNALAGVPAGLGIYGAHGSPKASAPPPPPVASAPSNLVFKPYVKAFLEFAGGRPEILCLSADLTSSCEVDQFRDQYPEQFVSGGMAEQNLLSMAGGLALEGFRPFVHTFAVFLYRRPYDQLVNSIAYSNRRVRLMGFLPGITTPGGITHQAIEDIAVFRTIPNMTVLETGDATEVETVLPVADGIDGPVYVRVLRGEVPRLFDTPFRFNELRVLSEGADALVLTAGITTEEAMRASQALRDKGVHLRHLHASTLKPFAREQLLQHLSCVRGGIITLENHLITGGLGSIVAEILAEEGLNKRLIRLGLNDTFAHGASRPYLMKKYGLDALRLVRAVEELLGHRTGLQESDLHAVRLDAVHSAAKAEAL
jgi:transketolase